MMKEMRLIVSLTYVHYILVIDEYLMTTIWSLGICVSAFGLQMEADKKLRILSTLNKHIDSAEGVPPTSVSNIPSLAFSLTCFFN